MSLERLLGWLADIQYRHHVAIVAAAVVITAFMAQGVTKVYMEGDIEKSMPHDLPYYQNKDIVDSKFGGADTILVVVELDHGSNIKNRPHDIRDPRVMQMLIDLQSQLEGESKIDRVMSAGSFFPQGVPQTTEGVKTVLKHIPGSDGVFNKDYSITLLYAYANVGFSEKNVKSFTGIIQDNIDSVPKPPGVKLSITGGPPMVDTMMSVLWGDAVYTITLAAAVILFLLIILQRSIYKGVLVFIPLSLGLTWTLGAMGHMNIPLSIATVAIGAMILGLGVEYGVFVVERYMEERERKGRGQRESLHVAVTGVGGAILGSGTTTIVGFGALTLSVLPMLQDLGKTLALGIASCLIVALFVNPAFIIFAGKVTRRNNVCKR
ncbi:MAG: MMPL family transporter [Candidatus Altiarchaeales archaeon]|nr:MMPL family transporter [Candidatus Altiarchaeales archaeon]MBD3415533.1 MMPL family transporter [Candidatus Altiarchaeales archaeon]